MIARTSLGRTVALVLSLALSQVAATAAQAATPHIVDSQQVAARLAERAAVRESQVKLVQEALDNPATQKQASAMGFNVGNMRAAVPHLSDAELTDISQRAANVKDVAAGHGGNDGLVIAGVVLLVVGLAILVAVGGYEETYYDDCGCYY